MSARTAEVTMHFAPGFLDEPHAADMIDEQVRRKFQALGTLVTAPTIVDRATEAEDNEYGVPAGSERRTYQAKVEPDTPN